MKKKLRGPMALLIIFTAILFMSSNLNANWTGDWVSKNGQIVGCLAPGAACQFGPAAK